MRVNPLQRKEEVFADHAEEAELEQGSKGDVGVGGVDVSEDLDGLGANKDARLGLAGGGADGGPEDRDVDGAFGGGARAKPGAPDGFGDVELVVEADNGSRGGVLRKKNGGKIGVGDAGPVKGAGQSFAAGDFLGRRVLLFAVGRRIQLGGSVELGVFLVAEAAGPAEQRLHGGAVAGDLDIGVEDVRLVKAKGLFYVEVAIRKVERELGRRGKVAGRGGNVQGAGQGGGEGGVVGVEGEGIAELLGGLGVHNIEGSSVGIFFALQDPGGHLRAAVREGDAVKLVFNGGGRFGGGGDGGLEAGSGKGLGRGRRDAGGGLGRRRGGGLALGGGLVGGGSLRIVALAVKLEAEEDGNHEEHDSKQAAVVLAAAGAALLIGVGELWHGVWVLVLWGRAWCGRGVLRAPLDFYAKWWGGGGGRIRDRTRVCLRDVDLVRFGHGVQASGSKGMAAKDAAKGEPRSADGAVAVEGDNGILGAGGKVAAVAEGGRGKNGREGGFIDAEGELSEVGHGRRCGEAGPLGSNKYDSDQGPCLLRSGGRRRCEGFLSGPEEAREIARQVGEGDGEHSPAGMEDQVCWRCEEVEVGTDQGSAAALDAVAVVSLAKRLGDSQANAWSISLGAASGGAKREEIREVGGVFTAGQRVRVLVVGVLAKAVGLRHKGATARAAGRRSG